jgi:predicted DNA-binding transcriptional regulator YafY
METAPCLITWCELRGDFRRFRIDRIHKIEVMPGTFAVESGKELEDYPPQGPGGKPGVII